MAIDLPLLVRDMKVSNQELYPFRKKLLEHAKESAGGNYGSQVGVENPVNLISLYERIIMGHLVGGDPRMMVSTFDRQLKASCSTFEDDCNRRLKRMGFRDILRQAVRDALYQVGVVKVAITAPTEARFGGYGKTNGEVAISNIDFEDFVCDMRAKRFKECSFIGHRYFVLLEDAKKSKLFKREARKNLTATTDDIANPGGGDRMASISRSQVYKAEFEEWVELWELYLPRRNKVVTFAAYSDELLLEQDWVGPACGPYHFLSYCEVIGQLLPKGPIMDLINLAREQNTHWKHLNFQASKQKTIVAYRDAEDAAKIDDKEEGGFVKMNDPQAITEVVVHSGPNINVANWVNIGAEKYNEMAGNLRTLGGMGAEADTATQEKLIHSSASALVNAQGQRVHQFTQEIFQSLGWFCWMSPHETMKSYYAPAGNQDVGITRKVTPYDRFGKPFEEHDIQLDPYSLMAQTPQSKLAVMQATMEKYIIPLLPMYNQPGVGEMLDAFIRQVAKLTNVPELIDLLEKLVGVQGPAEEKAQGEQMPGQPQEPNTTTRISKPGMTEDGNRQVLQQLMAGGQPNAGAGAQGLGQMGAA